MMRRWPTRTALVTAALVLAPTSAAFAEDDHTADHTHQHEQTASDADEAARVADDVAGAADWIDDMDAGDLSVLVYTRTASFRHLSIPDGVAAIEELGEEHGFDVEHTEDPEVFTDDELARFDVVIFLNTTGDVVDADGEEAFERYVRGGGGWMGVHSAADTEYDWSFYGQLLGGAWFHSHPVQQPGVLRIEDTDHPSTSHLGDTWVVPFEEYYSYVANPREHVHVLMNIDEDSYLQDPNTTHLPDGPEMPDLPPEGESGVMGDHPMAWCQQIDDGHAFYTALGHESYLYRVEAFRTHLLGGVMTAAGVLDVDCTPGSGEDDESTNVPSQDETDAVGEEQDEADTGAQEPPSTPPAGGPGESSTPTLPATGGGSGPAALVALLTAALVGAATSHRYRPAD